MHHASHFWPAGLAHARHRSVRQDRFASTRCATREGLICRDRRRIRAPWPRGSRAGPHQAQRDGAKQRALRATRRQLNADARDIFDHTGGDLDQALADGRELGTGERVCRRDRSAHPMHQPVRGSVEYEPDLIGDRAVCAHITPSRSTGRSPRPTDHWSNTTPSCRARTSATIVARSRSYRRTLPATPPM